MTKPVLEVEPEATLEMPTLEELQSGSLAKRPSTMELILHNSAYAAQAQQHVERLAQTLEYIRLAAIRATFPSDWVLHGSKTDPKRTGYLMDDGCQRAIPLWGMVRKLEVRPQREDFPDGSYVYRIFGAARCLRTGLVVEEIGSRWSGSHFFRKLARARGMPDVDPTLVEKAALKNFDGRCFRYLAGLNGYPATELAHAWGSAEKLAGCTLMLYEEKTGPVPSQAEAPPAKARPGAAGSSPATETAAPDAHSVRQALDAQLVAYNFLTPQGTWVNPKTDELWAQWLRRTFGVGAVAQADVAVLQDILRKVRELGQAGLIAELQKGR